MNTHVWLSMTPVSNSTVTNIFVWCKQINDENNDFDDTWIIIAAGLNSKTHLHYRPIGGVLPKICTLQHLFIFTTSSIIFMP